MNLKKYLLVVGILAAVGCSDGKNGHNGANGSDGATGAAGVAGSNGASAPTDTSILGNFTNTDPNGRIQALNLTSLSLNQVQSLAPALDCASLLNGQPDETGASPAINGVALNEVSISGSTNYGIIQFGPLSHANQDLDNECYTIGQEEYTYSITGNTLTLCDSKYSVCSEFTAQ